LPRVLIATVVILVGWRFGDRQLARIVAAVAALPAPGHEALRDRRRARPAGEDGFALALELGEFAFEAVDPGGQLVGVAITHGCRLHVLRVNRLF
jgi:hypothetical protein